MARLQSYFFVFTFLLLFSLTQAAPSISHYNLINTETGKVVRRLKNGQDLTVSHPFTIEAVPVQTPRIFVFFFTTYSHRSIHAPYVLPGIRVPKFRALTLFPQQYTIYGYADSNYNNNLTISFNIKAPNVPRVGPLPKANPKNHQPQDEEQCKKPLNIKSVTIDSPLPEYSLYGRTVTTKISYCQNAKLRVRLMHYSHPWLIRSPSTHGKTYKLANATTTIQKNGMSTIALTPPFTRCGNRAIYIEVCTLTMKKCVTSPFQLLRYEQPADPAPLYRPPIKLFLSPGDRARLTFAVKNITNSTDGFTNGVSPRGRQFLLQSTLKLPFGRRLFTSGKPMVTNSTALDIPSKAWKKGVPGGFNGAIFQVRFAPAYNKKCGIWDLGEYENDRYTTKLFVGFKYPQLLKQDQMLPKIFKTPRYPPTKFGDRVTLSVSASNAQGGGRLKSRDGNIMPTKMHYQWYVRSIDNYGRRYYAEPIVGATKKSLTLADARCNKSCWSRWGVIGLHIYYVDVCNTFGCRRSEPIFPNILPPKLKPGQKWNKFYCALEGEGNSCSGGQRYCVANGLVQECSDIKE